MLEALDLYREHGFDPLFVPKNEIDDTYFRLLPLAHFFLPMSIHDRMTIESASHDQWHHVSHLQVTEIIHRTLERSNDKLSRIGLNPDTYMEFIMSMLQSDTQTMLDIIAVSQANMSITMNKNKQSDEALAVEYDRDLMKKHQLIINNFLRPVKTDLAPVITIVMGSPGMGKSEFVKSTIHPNRRQVVHIDPDRIRKILRPKLQEHDQAQIEEAKYETWRFNDNLMLQTIERRLPLLMETTLAQRNFWLQNEVLHMAKDAGYEIEIKAIEGVIANAFRRTVFRNARLVSPADFIYATTGYANLVEIADEYEARVSVQSFVKSFERDTGLVCELGKFEQHAMREYASQHPDRVTITDRSDSVPIIK